jgi:hypothetical protein
MPWVGCFPGNVFMGTALGDPCWCPAQPTVALRAAPALLRRVVRRDSGGYNLLKRQEMASLEIGTKPLASLWNAGQGKI